MSAQLRMATSRDLQDLLHLIRPFRSPAFNWSEELFRSEFAGVQTWVLQVDLEIVAFACLRDAIDAWEVSVLATHVDHQERGYMQKLLGGLIEKFGRERHFWLEVHEKNLAAQKLYEKMGFQHDGNRGGYYTDGSSALLYSLPRK